MTVQPNTWHYRIASLYGRGEFYRRTNLCAYFWRFAFGLVILAFIVSMGTFLSYLMLAAPAMWLLLCITDWHLYELSLEALMGIFIWSLTTTFLSVVVYAAWRDSENKSFIPLPAPIREAYRGWKEKYCPVIEIAE